MSKNTGISWTDHTFNIAWGCTKVSPGCANCYADRDAKRYGFDIWGPKADRRTFGEKHWRDPIKWDEDVARLQTRRRVFCSSMCDVFEDHPKIARERARLWDVVRATPHLTWQILTKRADRIQDCTPDDIFLRSNVWFGVSAENQEWWDKRVPVLLKTRARTTFVSAEPLIGQIVPGPEFILLDWLIIGGESGGNRRPCETKWITELAKDAVNTHVKVFVKQHSAFTPGQRGDIPDEIWKLKEFPKNGAC